MYKTAHVLFQSEVVGAHKLYHRYKMDFLNGHSFPLRNDAASMNEHEKNHGILEELLENRNDLVEKYFRNKVFTYDDYLAIQRELDTTTAPEFGIAPQMNFIKTAPQITFKSCMDEHQLTLLTKYFNVLPLFKTEVNIELVKDLFNCSLSTPLCPHKNTILVYVFNELSKHHLICNDWQNVIETTDVILSSGGNHLTHDNLSTTLHRKLNTDTSEYIGIKNYIKEIAES